MKPTVRLITLLITLMCVALLGASHVALAGSPCGSVPCTPSTGEIGPGPGGTINLGTSVVTVGDNSGYVDVSETPCSDRTSTICGPSVYVNIMDIHRNPEDYSTPPTQICFANPLGGGIFRWYTPSELGNVVGAWVQFPSFIKDNMICTLSYMPGTFAVIGH